MSTEKVELKGQDNSKKQEGYSATIDVEMKLMEVGSQKYNVDMKQNEDSRFCCIRESSSGNYRNRIVIPMSCFPMFNQKILEIMSFSTGYMCCNVSEKKFPRDRTVFAKSTSCFTPGGRRYYFDVIDAQSVLTLRLSYVFNGRRDSIKILVEALPNLLEIVEEYSKKYPSISSNDDYPANNTYRRRPTKRMSGGSNGGPRHYTRGSTFGFGSSRRSGGQSKFNGKVMQHKDQQGSDTKKTGSLKVLTDPAPLTIGVNAKKYLFEVVEGTNTFLRVTEAINDNYKSSLHIPIEALGQVQSAIVDINKKYCTVKGSSASKA